MRIRLALLFLLLSTTSLAFGAEKADGSIQISFTESAMRASGVSQGGDAIVFACTIGRYSGFQKLGRHAEVIHDADRDGAIELTIAKPTISSLWVVVDFTTGAYAVAAPPGLEVRSMNVPEHGWKKGREHFDLRRDYLEVLVVRPGEGAWTLSASEGGANDDDGNLNSVLRARLASMQRLHGADTAPRPPVIVPKDLLVVIDPHYLDYFASEPQ